MGIQENQHAIDAFTAACRDEPLIEAAFLGGSMASGTADDYSDLDLYLIIPDEAYEAFFAKRNEFMRRWSDPVLLHDVLNFEGLGWDMVVFVLSDGVEGELALGRCSNFMNTHGGAHKVLVDKTGVLEGVEFPLYQLSQEQRVVSTGRDLSLFWRELFKLTKVLARDNLWAAQTLLSSLRRRCKAMSDQFGDPEAAKLLDTTFVLLDRDAIIGAARVMIRFNLQVGPALAEKLGTEYPAALQEVALRQFEEAFGVEIVQAKD